jgi:hypothetical protein
VSADLYPMPEPAPFRDPDRWADLLEITGREVTGDATAQERMEIRRPAMLVPWYRALSVLRHDVEARQGDAKSRLTALAKEEVTPTGAASPVYLAEKAEFERRNAGRLRFRQGVLARQEECRFLMREYGITPLDGTAVLDAVVRALDLLEVDDVDAARGLLVAFVKRMQGSPQ